jgi:hypothetical protein
MATVVNGAAMNGLSVETHKVTQRYVLDVRVQSGTHHQNLRGGEPNTGLIALWNRDRGTAKMRLLWALYSLSCGPCFSSVGLE